MLRLLHSAAHKREVKATQNLSIIVLFFIICWIVKILLQILIVLGTNIDFFSATLHNQLCECFL